MNYHSNLLSDKINYNKLKKYAYQTARRQYSRSPEKG